MYRHLGKTLILVTAFFVALLGFYANTAVAHRVTIFAWVEGDKVYTESKFSGGKSVKTAVVEVFDDKGEKLLEGKTDDNGKFSFKIQRKTEMKIVLQAGMGHRASWLIPLDAITAVDAGNDETAPQKLAEVEYKDSVWPVSNENAIPSPCITPDEIQTAVDEAMDKKLKPVMEKLNKLSDPDKGPEVTDILAGIGYILGLVGIAAYVNNRRKKD